MTPPTRQKLKRMAQNGGTVLCRQSGIPTYDRLAQTGHVTKTGPRTYELTRKGYDETGS